MSACVQPIRKAWGPDCQALLAKLNVRRGHTGTHSIFFSSGQVWGPLSHSTGTNPHTTIIGEMKLHCKHSLMSLLSLTKVNIILSTSAWTFLFSVVVSFCLIARLQGFRLLSLPASMLPQKTQNKESNDAALATQVHCTNFDSWILIIYQLIYNADCF